MQYKLDKPVHGEIGVGKYQCSIEWRNGNFICDEPPIEGGADKGPDPFTLLLSAVASCALVTLRMYIDHEGWHIPSIAVNTNLYQETKEGNTTTIIDCDILFLSPVSEEQKVHLLEIATNCAITKLLEGDVKTRTFVFRDGDTKNIHYANDEITVVWKPEFCQHSTRCWTQLPEVFDPKVRKWINPEGASSERIDRQVKKCPSGALEIFYNEKKD